MGETYSCALPGCGKIFSRAFELRKHKVAHEDPNSLFRCPICDFITLQKKNLRVHVATHTGEKALRCQHMITVSGPAGTQEERCAYRTNDPAALSKHRKRIHGHVPPPNRIRPSKTAATKAAPTSPCKPQEKKGGNAFQRPSPYPRPHSVPHCKPSHATLVANNPSGNVSSAPTATVPPSASVFAPLLWQGNMSAYSQPMAASSFHVPGVGSSSGALVVPYGGMGMYPMYDPSFNPDWLAAYEMSYNGSFDAAGMTYPPELVGASSAPADVGVTQTGREGCLCPEWMVQAGIEGWDQSVLETHKEFYAFNA